MDNLFVKINRQDNVAVAVKDLKTGTEIMSGVKTINDIPQAHKIALEEIPCGHNVIRYGVVLGQASVDIHAGEWVQETMIEAAESPDLDHLEFATDLETDLPEPPVHTWMGYRNPNGGYAGTRNILAIQTTVQCVSGVLNIALRKIKKEILPKYPNVDDVIAINHPYGCGVAIDADNSEIPQRILKNIAIHPNFGGQFMLVSLGCEKFTVERFCSEFPEWNTSENVIVLQEQKGMRNMIDAICTMAEKKLQVLNERKREKLPLSDLLVGMQCGGSDAFSGISANPAAGRAGDMIVRGGGTVMFSEVTEVRDAVPMLARRCVNEEVGRKLAAEMRWYDNYLNASHFDRSANPTPGNHKGGLSNIVEKAMGSVAKSGRSPIVEVLSPGERPTKHGKIFAATPASDLVCGPCQLASGMGLEVFMTGRGTPYSLAAAPVIKVCSRNEMKEQWEDLIDINAGSVETGEKTVEDVSLELFNEIIAVASGKKPFAEEYELANDLCIFNPAPIT